MPSSSDTRGSSAPTVRAIHEPNDMPAAQSGRPGKRSLAKSSARAEVVLSRRGRRRTCRRCGPTPRKLKRSTATPMRGQRLGRLIDRLGVHRAAVQRMRMAAHGDRARLALRQVEQRFERAGRARRSHAETRSARLSAPSQAGNRSPWARPSANSPTSVANSRDRVMAPRCPVPCMVTARARGSQARYSAVCRGGTT